MKKLEIGLSITILKQIINQFDLTVENQAEMIELKDKLDNLNIFV